MTSTFDPPNPSSELSSGLVDHLGADLWRAFRRYELAMFQRVAALGFEDIVVADSDVLVHVSRAGARLADISKLRGATKQAVHERVHSLVSRGYLELRDDPKDKRVKVVCFTKRGTLLVEKLKQVKLALHREVTALLGAKQTAALRSMLAKIEASIQ